MLALVGMATSFLVFLSVLAACLAIDEVIDGGIKKSIAPLGRSRNSQA